MTCSAASIASLPKAERARIIQALSRTDIERLDKSWEFWARPEQLEPPGQWLIWLILAGRGFGKTRSGSEWVRKRVENGAQRIIIAGPTAGDLREAMIEGESGILAISPAWNRPKYEPSKLRLTWPSGARATLISADEPERFRNKQADTIWCLVADSRVLMADGAEKRIADVQAGDSVQTREGPKRVTRMSRTGTDRPLWTVTTSEGRVLIGTPDHRIFADGRFTRLDMVRPGAILQGWSSSSSSTVGTTGTTDGTISGTRPDSYSTVSCGRRRTGRSRRGSTSTTSTTTSSTTASRTSSCSPAATTSRSTSPAGSRRGLQSGEPRTRGLPGRGDPKLSESASATVAARRIGLGAPTATGAPRSAKSAPAITVRKSESQSERGDVYNLTVEGAHEYFAEGVLVHNCDELAAWPDRDAWDQLQFTFRLIPPGKLKLRCMVTTTPKPKPLIKELVSRESPTDVVITRGSTYDNRPNLSPAFYDTVVRPYEGTRLGRQELNAEILNDVEGALWTRDLIERTRVREAPKHEQFVRLVVAVDPAVTANETSDETGIVVVGRTYDGHYYLLADASGRMSPLEWAKKATALYSQFGCDRVVAEENNGGKLVEANLRTVWRNVPYLGLRASTGKRARAEPVVSLYERGLVHHVGGFSKLEDQLCTWEPNTGMRSPDRLDALVWAVTDLAFSAARNRVYLPESFESA